jgi:nitrous oxide reductase accessory protein NosL
MISFASAGERKPITPSSKDECPVCGMFSDTFYPNFVAEIIFKDGSYAVFDGPKDMFEYYFNLSKYNPQKKLSDIDSIYVMDYYNLVWIDGIKAYYVIGSSVAGPMGKELIPFSEESDAKDFIKGHGGASLLRFEEITYDRIKGLR